MPESRLDFVHDGERYGLTLDYGDPLRVDSLLHLQVAAFRNDERAATGELRLDQEGRVALLLNGEQFFSTHLIDFPEGDDVLIQILEQVPALDPVIGCLIKGGFLAMLQQILACRRRTDAGLPWLPRLRLIARCVMDNFPGLAMNAAFRAARCIFAGGLF